MAENTPLFDFKVWIEKTPDNIFAAYCLQTGAVATADDPDTVDRLISETLEHEAAHAIETGNFANLYSSPAPEEIWLKWNAMAMIRAPKVRILAIRTKTPPRIPDMPEADKLPPKKPVVSQKLETFRVA